MLGKYPVPPTLLACFCEEWVLSFIKDILALVKIIMIFLLRPIFMLCITTKSPYIAPVSDYWNKDHLWQIIFFDIGFYLLLL